jgi:hypothetical protein
MFLAISRTLGVVSVVGFAVAAVIYYVLHRKKIDKGKQEMELLPINEAVQTYTV